MKIEDLKRDETLRRVFRLDADITNFGFSFLKDGTLVNHQYNQWKARNGLDNNIFTHALSGSCREERKCVVFGHVITITRIYWTSGGTQLSL